MSAFPTVNGLPSCPSHSPWKAAYPDGRNGLVVLDARGQAVALICHRMFMEEANAQLIAAAPELLMALQMALPAVEYFDEHEGGEIVLEVVRAAIAKARGGAHV